ncbi:TetR/AcrR family transcriptional regulator [Sporosarcina pasteurii]|uniref:HTH-type transcriptional repressor KstR2 n=1 Tax=Sporosarcina pasteurii TaxID=1474 RepID=A0A380C347_SPOPA|nr:TetR/AcrR family transcriptional regulator [Sporosarcina pasteurii]MDS9471592.1 TetR/AcrR family transcriptional regulator [Sporosarcina pasteurii]QBQ04794.1 TetR/AcrR family transcriptional regulator [Sporosarcina pasteurii]SUJ11227.1 HTH-type transcriptional repressor KstR2 [Sporosarcina pasteurii]
MKQEITKHSVKLFQEKGFSETSIQDIVDSLGVTKGTFYYYFKSKEQLLMDIHLRYIDELLDFQKEIIENEQTCRDKVVKIVGLIIGDIKSQRANGRVYFREMRNLKADNAEIIKAKRSEFREKLERIIVEGMESGEFRHNLNAKMITLAILGVTNWTYQWMDPSGDVTVEEVAEMFADFVLHGIHV